MSTIVSSCNGNESNKGSTAVVVSRNRVRQRATTSRRSRDHRRPSTEVLAHHAHHLHHGHHTVRRAAQAAPLDVHLIESAVKQALLDSPYREHSLLSVRLVGGAIELHGQTTTYFMKQMAQELAKTAVAQVRIRNFVKVAD